MNTLTTYFKKTAVSLLIIFSFIVSLPAQEGERLNSTIIVDVLNELPANNQKKYNRLMKDLVSTGEEGVNILLEMLLKKDGSYVPVQYAIDGLSSYVSSEQIAKGKKEVIINSIKKYLEKVGDTDLELKEILAKQLKTLGYIALTAEEDQKPSVKEALRNLKKASTLTRRNNNYQNRAVRSASLHQLIEVAGLSGNEKLILKAIDDDSREYRFTALTSMTDKASDDLIEKIIVRLPKLHDEAKADVLYWLGEAKNKKSAATVIDYLLDPSFEVTQSAAWATTKIGTEEGMRAISNLLASSDQRKVSLAESCLKSYSGDVVGLIVPKFSELNPLGQVSIINVIAQRKSIKNKDLVLGLLTSSEEPLKSAAYKALKSVSKRGDVGLFNILEKAEEAYVKDVQSAIIVSFSKESKDKQYQILSARKNSVSSAKQGLYWPLIIESADLGQLYEISRTTLDDKLFTQSFNTYLRTVSKSKSFTGEQKLLQLRKIMEVARTDANKKAVLKAVSSTNTFLGIIFAGEYIEVPALQQFAATAVHAIALGNKSFNGPEVVALLKRTAEVLKGPDADYTRTAIDKYLSELPKAEEGFVSIFNGQDLRGWQGLVGNPISRDKMKTNDLAKAQKEADEKAFANWVVEDGEIVFLGKGKNLCTEKMYGDFEMYVDWLLYPEGPEADAGIYLRGSPQVQIWDTSRVKVGAQVGSGGLYNNKKNPSAPLCVADNKLGEWNSFYIKMVGERVTIYLNGILVVDNVILENYWNRTQPIFPKGAIELQAHGSKVAYRNLYVKELEQVKPYELSAAEKEEGFELLFDGTSLHNWQGNTVTYSTQDGTIAVTPSGVKGFKARNLYTNKEYSDFIFRFEFKLTAGANNGVGIRTKVGANAAYDGMEIQILDHYADIYKGRLKDYQYHGSVYGILSTHNKDMLKPVGEWNVEEIYVKGTYVRVTLNGVVITEGDLKEATKDGTLDKKEHPGLFNKSGHIGFLGHGSKLWLRNIRIKELELNNQ